MGPVGTGDWGLGLGLDNWEKFQVPGIVWKKVPNFKSSLGKISLVKNTVGKRFNWKFLLDFGEHFHWEKFHWNKYPLDKSSVGKKFHWKKFPEISNPWT